jgi:hypothetical protein
MGPPISFSSLARAHLRRGVKGSFCARVPLAVGERGASFYAGRGVAFPGSGNPLLRKLEDAGGLLPPRSIYGVFLAALEGRGDHVLDRIELALGLAYGDVGLFGHPLDELRLVHEYAPPLDSFFVRGE